MFTTDCGTSRRSQRTSARRNDSDGLTLEQLEEILARDKQNSDEGFAEPNHLQFARLRGMNEKNKQFWATRGGRQ
jgi:hypothetical protein